MVSLILDWFDRKFIVVYRSDMLRAMRKLATLEDRSVYVEKTLTLAAKEFGVTTSALGYRKDGENTELCSILKNGKKTQFFLQRSLNPTVRSAS